MTAPRKITVRARWYGMDDLATTVFDPSAPEVEYIRADLVSDYGGGEEIAIPIADLVGVCNLLEAGAPKEALNELRRKIAFYSPHQPEGEVCERCDGTGWEAVYDEGGNHYAGEQPRPDCKDSITPADQPEGEV